MQTRKIRRIPIVLVEEAFWSGLLEWMEQKMVVEGMLDAKDLGLLRVVEEPEEVLSAILEHYGERSYMPSESEEALMFEL